MLGRPSWRAYPAAPAPGTALCRLAEIADGGARLFVFGDGADGSAERFEMVVLRLGNSAVAYVNDCPHTHTPLDWPRGQFFNRAKSRLKCATHGALFRPADGYCTSGPCQGEFLTPVPVEITAGRIAVAASDLGAQSAARKDL